MTVDQDLLLWMGGMLKRIYTPALTFQTSEAVMFPLNPFKFIQNQLNVAVSTWLESIVPERGVLTEVFSSIFQMGAAIILLSWLQEAAECRFSAFDTAWGRAARSPGLK